MQQRFYRSPVRRPRDVAAPAAAGADGNDGLVSALALDAAAAARLRAAVAATGQPPAVAAVLLGLASDDVVAEASAALNEVPLWDGAAEALAPPSTLNPRFLAEHYAVVLQEQPDGLVVGLVDSGMETAKRGIAFAAGRPVTFRTIAFSAWRAGRDQAEVGGDGRGSNLEAWRQDVETLKDFARDAPVVRYLDAILERAAGQRASDVHFEQKADRCLVRLRVDGLLRDVESLPAVLGRGVIARTKVLADLDVASLRAPQDGRATVTIRGMPTDIRISTTPTVFGESAVLRLLFRQGVDFTLESLGFEPAFVETFSGQLRRPHGLILVTGPTGSGKTTTLYAALRRIANRDRKVLTVEDPIEYVFDGINQTQVNEAAGVTFASALRAFLRHDPDVILVGEIRDSETARLAVQAALTGHLVLATLHTNDAATAPARLADMGVERYLLASVLIGISAQRLAPRVCPHCAQPHPVTRAQADLFQTHGLAPPRVLREGRGCPACDGAGHAGRLPVGEIITVDEEIERMVAVGAPTADIRRRLGETGFQPIARDALSRAAQGAVSLDGASRTVRL